MSAVASGVQDHYGRGGLLGRIEAALADSGVDVRRLAPEQLYPLDQLHGRELVATREHLAKLGLDPHKHVLDVGSGIGGAARYIAATFGCQVTGIDLTEEFVAVARELTRRCGLDDRVRFERGDALAMPFADAIFDAASCLYVAMNIPDKAGLLRETARVLKPGGRLVLSIAVAGMGEPYFPLPWAPAAELSSTPSAESLRAVLDGAGLRVVEWTDETPIHLAYAERMRAAGPPPPGRITNQVVMGETFMETVRNLNRSLAEGRLRTLLIVANQS